MCVTRYAEIMLAPPYDETQTRGCRLRERSEEMVYGVSKGRCCGEESKAQTHLHLHLIS